ncbi:MAG: tetratricopeptide repeat protein, partial [bacterium]|nr:tetratricopeptide repeat protein [bacterium]
SGKFAGVVYVDGPAGIGKSRLIYELKESLKTSEFNLFTFPSDEILKQSLNPVITFLKEYFNLSENFSNEKKKQNILTKIKQLHKSIKGEDIRKELIRSQPFFAKLLNIPWKNSIIDLLSSKEKFDNILFGLKNLIKAESLNRKTVLVFEDVHWIDPDSIQFLNLLVRNVDNFPFIILIVSRLNDDNSVNRLPLDITNINSLFLEHLAESESINMIKTLLNSEVSSNLSKLIYEKSQGNPFFIEQIILYLRETGSLKKDKYSHLDLKTDKFDLPDKVSNIIIARIDRLESKLKQIIKTASVLGTEIPVRVLSEMLQDNKNIKSDIKDIEKEGIWSPLSEFLYIFKHVIIRDTIYEMQMKKKLKELHLLAGKSMEKIFKGNLEENYGSIAFHYEKGENEKKAKEFLLMAGDHAVVNYKNHEAIDYYERLLKYLSKTNKVIEVLTALGNASHITGNLDKAEEYFKNAYKKSSQLKDKKALAESILDLSRIKWLQLQYPESLKLIDKGMKLAQELHLSELQCEALNYQGTINFYLGNLKKAEQFYAESLEVIKNTKNYGRISGAYDNLAFIYSEKGDHIKALKYYKLSEKFGKLMNNKFFLKSNSQSLGNLYANLGMYEKALKYYKKATELSVEMGDFNYRYLGYLGTGFCYLYLGKYDTALNFIEKTLDISREQGGVLGLIYGMMYKGDIFLYQGNFIEARTAYQEVLDISKNFSNKRGIAACLMRFGNFHYLSGEINNSISAYKRAIKTFKEIGMEPQVASCSINLSSVLIKSNNIKSALSFINSAKRIAVRIKRKDLLLKANIHYFFILGLKNNEQSEKELNLLLQQSPPLEDSAQIYFYLYKLTNKKKYKSQAIKSYTQLNEKTPRIQYERMLKEMK